MSGNGEETSERKEKRAPRFETWTVWGKEVPRRPGGGKGQLVWGSIRVLLELR